MILHNQNQTEIGLGELRGFSFTLPSKKRIFFSARLSLHLLYTKSSSQTPLFAASKSIEKSNQPARVGGRKFLRHSTKGSSG